METITAFREAKSVTVQLEEGGPLSLMAEKDLAKRTIIDDNDREFTVAVEYRLKPDDTRAVHRSSHVTIKKPAAFAESVAGSF